MGYNVRKVEIRRTPEYDKWFGGVRDVRARDGGVMTRNTSETRRWDVVENLRSDEEIAAYLDAALEDGEPSVVAAALGDIARAKGMSQLARDTGLGRESLYRALSAEGNPEFATVMKVVKALGLKLSAQPA
jgi:probable addiction module antidote protein